MTTWLHEILKKNILRIQKPARYINQEINSFNKKFDKDLVSFCLIYPDLYEIGISNLGLKILYNILNKENDSLADRQYAPHPDLGAILKKKNKILGGIETGVELNKFDILGFTLQTELTFTNILYVLDLAGVPLNNSDRDENSPIILMGGPCAVNPHPLSDFGDLFLIGEAEEAIVEIKDMLKKIKREKRSIKIQQLSRIDGVYSPLYSKSETIYIRKNSKFHIQENFYSDQLIPWLQPTHDRFVSEIMRGCTRGCRFCFAGYFYRPSRERDPDDLVSYITEQIKKYGWEETSLVSLSSSDYSCIRELLTELFFRLDCHNTALSLPSLRADTIDDEILSIMQSLQQSGLTIAPEAGSQRLRDIINKQMTEEDILQGIKLAHNCRWRLIKLYFMVGLPFEKDEDIQEIIELIEKIIFLTNKKMKINITLSPFVPKVFTPFQWCAFQDREILIKRILRIKNSFTRYKFVKVSYHSLENSLLECILGRGDRGLGRVLETAYDNGACFDSWTEFFDFSRWEKALEDENINLQRYTESIDLTENLIWGNIDIGISKDFLKEEFLKASNYSENESRQVLTLDCRKKACTGCGACSIASIRPAVQKNFEKQKLANVSSDKTSSIKYRVIYEKTGALVFVGHLDMIRMLYRVLRATGLPIEYTSGFNIHPKVVFSQPLPLGMSSECEYFDFYLTEKILPEKILDSFPHWIESRIRFKWAIELSKQLKAENQFFFEEVHVKFPNPIDSEILSKIRCFQSRDKFLITKYKKNKEKTIDIKLFVRNIEIKDSCTVVINKNLDGCNVFDIVSAMTDILRENLHPLVVHRKRLY